jgi:hypothetical protein
MGRRARCRRRAGSILPVVASWVNASSTTAGSLLAPAAHD